MISGEKAEIDLDQRFDCRIWGMSRDTALGGQFGKKNYQLVNFVNN